MDIDFVELEIEFIRKERELIVPGYLRFLECLDPETYRLCEKRSGYLHE